MTTEARPQRLECNNRCILSILFAVVIMGFLPAYGRIGETPEQCEQRYGKPVGSRIGRGLEQDDLKYTIYKKEGFDISIAFFNGKAAKIIYDKKGNIGIDEIDFLLNANSAGAKWVSSEYHSTLVDSREKKQLFEKQKKVSISVTKWQTTRFVQPEVFFSDTSAFQAPENYIDLSAECFHGEDFSWLIIITHEFLASIEAQEKANKKSNETKHLDGF